MASRPVQLVGLYGGALLLLWLLVAFATTGLVAAVVAVGFAGFLVALIALGPQRLGVALVMLGTFLAPMNSQRPIPEGAATFSDVALLVGFTLLFPTMLTRRLPLSGLHIAGSVIIFFTGVIASLASADPATSLGYLARMLVALTLLPLAYLAWRPDRRQLQRLAWAYVIGQLVSTCGGILAGSIDNRYLGYTTHPNFYGMCGMLAAAVSLYLLKVVPRGPQRWFALAGLAASLGSVVLSGSRGALLASIAVAVVYPFLERSAKAAYLIFAGAATLMLSFATLVEALGEGSALSRLTGTGSAQGSNQERLELLQEGWSTFLEHPVLGTGLSFEVTLAHNGYLEVAIALGVFGLIGYLILLWGMLGPVLGTGRRNPLGYVVIGYACITLVNNTLWDRFAWVALSLALVGDQILREDPDDDNEAAAPTAASSRRKVGLSR